MFFRTADDAGDLARGYGYEVSIELQDVTLLPPKEVIHKATFDFSEKKTNSYVVAKAIVSWLGDFSSCVFWVTEYGIWPSSEDLHLYYRLRRSLGDFRHLHEAPCHDFLSFERNELITFLSIALQFGWGGVMFGTPPNSYLMLSHDSWFTIHAEWELDSIAAEASQMGLKVLI
jgi:hypothetical protein